MLGSATLIRWLLVRPTITTTIARISSDDAQQLLQLVNRYERIRHLLLNPYEPIADFQPYSHLLKEHVLGAPLLTMLGQRTRQVASPSLDDYESPGADTGGANYIRRYIVMVDKYSGDNVEQKRMALK
jgi:hypothetical protein